MIGSRTLGTGPQRVLVLNDWTFDTTSWDPALPFLDLDAFTWVFADLRGYGRSRGQDGDCTLDEAAGDVLELVDALGWDAFRVVGHSMSTLVALHLAQTVPDRIERLVLITPPPPTGFGVPPEVQAGIEALGRADDAGRLGALRARSDGRLGDTWLQYKVARWGAVADREAVARYVALFARDGLQSTDPVTAPVRVLTGEADSPGMRADDARGFLADLCPDLHVHGLADVGHHPMIEMPPMTAHLVTGFLR